MGEIRWYGKIEEEYLRNVGRHEAWCDQILIATDGTGRRYNPIGAWDWPSDHPQFNIAADPVEWFGHPKVENRVYQLFKEYLEYDVRSLLNTELNMAEGADHYSPQMILGTFTAFWQKVVELWDKVVDGDGLETDVITPSVNAHRAILLDTMRDDIVPEFEATVGNIHVGMNDAIMRERGRMWRRYLDDVDQFAANLRFELRKQMEQNKADLVKVGSGLSQVWVALEDLRVKTSLSRAEVRLGQIVNAVKLGEGIAADGATLRMKWSAVKAEEGWRKFLWPLEVHGKRNAAIASLPGGAGGGMPENSVTANVLSGALVGASIGADMSDKPSAGLWGAVIGGFAGWALK